MDIHGYSWISVDIHGYTWIFMDIHGPAYPPTKDSTKGGARQRAPFVEAAEDRLLDVWVCRGWAGSKHTTTLSPAKASFRAGPVPDPAVLVLDPAVLVLDPRIIHGYPWISMDYLWISMDYPWYP